MPQSGFYIDLDNDVITFDCGFSVPIKWKEDEDGEPADYAEDVVFIGAEIPDGLEMWIDLRGFAQARQDDEVRPLN